MKINRYSKSIISLFITLGLAALVLVICIVLYYKEKESNNLLSLINAELISDMNDCVMEIQSRKKESLLNGIKVSNTIKMQDKEGSTSRWESIIDGNKLVFFFSEGACSECIEKEISNIEKIKEMIGPQNIIFLIKPHSKRYIAQFKQIYKPVYGIYELKRAQQDLLPEFSPIFFVVEKESLRINSAFIPSMYKDNATASYLEILFDKYFNI